MVHLPQVVVLWSNIHLFMLGTITYSPVYLGRDELWSYASFTACNCTCLLHREGVRVMSCFVTHQCSTKLEKLYKWHFLKHRFVFTQRKITNENKIRTFRFISLFLSRQSLLFLFTFKYSKLKVKCAIKN